MTIPPVRRTFTLEDMRSASVEHEHATAVSPPSRFRMLISWCFG